MKIIALIKKSEFFQNILKMFSATALSQVIQVLGSLLLAKLYIPEQFGTFSIFMSILMFLVLLSTLRYESALIIEKNERTTTMLMHALFLYMLAFFVFTLLILLITPKHILIYYKINEIYLLIPFGVLSYGYYNTLISYNVRQKKFGFIAKIKIAIVLMIVFFQILFYYLNLNYGLVLGFSLGYFFASFYMFYTNKNSIILQSKFRITLVLKKYFYLIKFGLPTQILDTISSMVLPFLIVLWFNLKIAGIYFFAYKITNLPLQLIGVSIGKVFYQKASYLYNYKKDELQRFVIKIIGLTSVLIIIPLVVLFFFSKDIILLLLGNQWVKAGDYISILVFMLFFRTINSAISPIADITNSLHVVFIYSILIFATYVTAMYLGKSKNDFIMALTIISTVNALWYLLLIIYFVNKSKLKKV